jgi:hypothetical protein
MCWSVGYTVPLVVMKLNPKFQILWLLTHCISVWHKYYRISILELVCLFDVNPCLLFVEAILVYI